MNPILAGFGIWLTYKAVTDSAIMLAETYTNILKKIFPRRLLKKIICATHFDHR